MDSMKRQIAEQREELSLKQNELEVFTRRQMDDERDKNVLERREKSKLQKELETIEKNYSELEQ